MQARKRYDPHRINVFPSILSSGRDYAVALHYTGTVLLIKAGGKIANPGGPKLISKQNCRAITSSKKQTLDFYF